jgi:hypothetical protein
MNGPQLYKQYDRQQALSLFGRLHEAKALCEGQWLILPTAIVCLTTVGKPPRESHFHRASRFRWIADRPHQAADDEWAFLPLEVRAGRKDHRPVYLFVRAPAAQRFTYVGQLAPAHTWGVTRRHDSGFGEFDLSPTLPSQVWQKLGGPSPGDLDAFALDRSLQSLDRAQSVHDRLAILRRLAEYWHGPIGPGEGFSEEELRRKSVPFPLRWWYQLAGRHESILSGQNKLLEPDELKLDQDGRLLFYVENQGVYLWSTTLHGDDPPVFGKFNEAAIPWTQEGMALSEFLIGACLFQAIMQAPFGASAAWAEDATLSQISADLAPLPLAPWRWPSSPSRFFARNGAFMFASPNDDNQGNKAFSLRIGAKTERPLAFLKAIVEPKTWEYIAV